MATITDYIEQLEKINAKDRYLYFNDLGSEYPYYKLSGVVEGYIEGIHSDMWIFAEETPVGWEFKIQGGSYVNLGIADMVCKIVDGMTTNELSQVVWQDFAELGKLFSKEDKQLIQAVLNKCKQLSKG